MRRFASVLALAVASTVALATPGAARAAADYPNRPVKWIVPYPPGGTTDVLARIVAQWLSDKMGQPFVIENRAGGLARTVERRGVDGCNRIGLGILGQVRGGGLSHATAKVGKMEVGQSLIEQMVGVIYLAMPDEMDGSSAHESPFCFPP